MPKLLLVGHQGVEPKLEYVEPELNLVRTVKGIETESLFGPKATPDLVLREMVRHPWVHFACHGFIDHDSPFDSYFQLEQKQPLAVKDIIRAKLPSAELTFLSACHSAAMRYEAVDESLSLASALQLAGFRSVVGAMWKTFDKDGPELSRDFYKELMKRGGSYKDSAAALHYAIKRMRKREAPIECWAMFVHIGA